VAVTPALESPAFREVITGTVDDPGCPSAQVRPIIDQILKVIWLEQRVSRAEIARKLAVSRSTVSDAVSILLDTGLVREAGDGPSSGGRRPILLEFRDDACVILGVDLGATHVAVALTDLRGRVLAFHDRSHPVRTDPEGTRSVMMELCEKCLRDARRPLVGIGVSMPAPVDPADPGHVSRLVLPAWEGRTGFEPLGVRFGVPILVDNDANLGALAERWWGAGMGKDDFTYVKISTGIGAGHMMNGAIYRGSSGFAGEIGHIAVVPDGEPCICGNRGCLGTVVGSQALVARAEALRPRYPDSLLAGGELTIDAVEDAALRGDPLGLQVVREAADYLGLAIAEVLNLMNPSSIIVGGNLARLGETLLVPLREAVLPRTLVSSVAASEIRTSELGPRSVAIGAATLVLGAALDSPSLFPKAA
jgi:predicted NBD/HSP70 family sugar kinase